MRRHWAFFIITILLVSGCVPNFEKDEEIVNETDNSQETAIVPKFKISDQYYRTVLPFKMSEARGLVVSRTSNRLDIDEFETGLMRLSQDVFSSEGFLYQDGQYLERETVSSWLKRKVAEEVDVALNPAESTEGTLRERNEASPIYLSHIIEQNYLKKDEDGKAVLGGISIGLAMNSVHYYNQEDGYPREYIIEDAEIERQGKIMSEAIIQRIRDIEGLDDIPVVIGLFKQEARSSVVPGSFISVTEVKAKSNRIEKWKDVNEEYYLLPSSDAQVNYREDHTRMLNFKTEIEEYFPNYTGVIGRGFYRDEQLAELTIEIPMQFYGKAELIGFTQYVTGLILEHFPVYISVKCYISSIGGQEALIIREAGKAEPFVHIY